MPGAVQAITIDFWNTLVKANTNGTLRTEVRLSRLEQVANTCRPDAPFTRVRVEEAYRQASVAFDAIWRTKHLTPGTSLLLETIWTDLGLTVVKEHHDHCVNVFEEALLLSPPDLTDGVVDALAELAGRYPLAIISDTMFTPGRVLRKFLESKGIRQYFSAFVFSDEVGFAKPDTRAFQQAATLMGVPVTACAHIGDLRRTDITGAAQAGAQGILYTGACMDEEPGPEPNHVLGHWADLPGLLRS